MPLPIDLGRDGRFNDPVDGSKSNSSTNFSFNLHYIKPQLQYIYTHYGMGKVIIKALKLNSLFINFSSTTISFRIRNSVVVSSLKTRSLTLKEM